MTMENNNNDLILLILVYLGFALKLSQYNEAKNKVKTRKPRTCSHMDLDTVDCMIIIIHKRANMAQAQWISLSRVIMVILFYEIVLSANEFTFKILDDTNSNVRRRKKNEIKL